MTAFLVNSIDKVLVDYTGMIDCEDIEDKTDVDMLNTVFVVLESSWFLFVLAFLRVTKKEFCLLHFHEHSDGRAGRFYHRFFPETLRQKCSLHRKDHIMQVLNVAMRLSSSTCIT